MQWRSSLSPETTLDNGHAPAAKDNTIAFQTAMQQAAALAGLEGGEAVVPEPLRPKRH